MLNTSSPGFNLLGVGPATKGGDSSPFASQTTSSSGQDADWADNNGGNYSLEDLLSLEEFGGVLEGGANEAAPAMDTPPGEEPAFSRWLTYVTSWMTPATLTTILVPSIFGVIMFVGK